MLDSLLGILEEPIVGDLTMIFVGMALSHWILHEMNYTMGKPIGVQVTQLL